MAKVEKIISGAQTGADRAALNFAIANGISHGGWCPKDRKAEDGVIDVSYQLQETPLSDYLQRTEWNVRDSDGTVIFSIGPILCGGSAVTAEFAQKYGRPFIHISKELIKGKAATELRTFIHDHGIRVLNIAGPRASDEPNIGLFVNETLQLALLTSGFNDVIGHPKIKTNRLTLRTWDEEDAVSLVRLAGEREIADTMISVPHPYTPEYAVTWIRGHSEAFAKGEAIHFAIVTNDTGLLVGAIELRSINIEHCNAELSFWIGRQYWGQGYATEVTESVVKYGFEILKLNRIYAFYMLRNPASGKVLSNIGMKKEGLLRQCVQKWNRFEDVVSMAILREDWIASIGMLNQTRGRTILPGSTEHGA